MRSFLNFAICWSVSFKAPVSKTGQVSAKDFYLCDFFTLERMFICTLSRPTPPPLTRMARTHPLRKVHRQTDTNKDSKQRKDVQYRHTPLVLSVEFICLIILGLFSVCTVCHNKAQIMVRFCPMLIDQKKDSFLKLFTNLSNRRKDDTEIVLTNKWAQGKSIKADFTISK
jgi:hypothetical protein